MIRNQTTLIDNDTEVRWKVDRRTRGNDVDNGRFQKPTQTWILILLNSKGERRFVPEAKVLESYRLG